MEQIQWKRQQKLYYRHKGKENDQIIGCYLYHSVSMIPLVSLLHTNTIAVHGAAPSRTAMARYPVASSDMIYALKIINKNRVAIPTY